MHKNALEYTKTYFSKILTNVPSDKITKSKTIKQPVAKAPPVFKTSRKSIPPAPILSESTISKGKKELPLTDYRPIREIPLKPGPLETKGTPFIIPPFDKGAKVFPSERKMLSEDKVDKSTLCANEPVATMSKKADRVCKNDQRSFSSSTPFRPDELKNAVSHFPSPAVSIKEKANPGEGLVNSSFPSEKIGSLTDGESPGTIKGLHPSLADQVKEARPPFSKLRESLSAVHSIKCAEKLFEDTHSKAVNQVKVRRSLASAPDVGKRQMMPCPGPLVAMARKGKGGLTVVARCAFLCGRCVFRPIWKLLLMATNCPRKNATEKDCLDRVVRTIQSYDSDPRLTVEGTLEKIPFCFQIDTGSEACIIHEQQINKIPNWRDLPEDNSNMRLLDANLQELYQETPPKLLTFDIKGKQVTHPVFVISGRNTDALLLGMCFLQHTKASLVYLHDGKHTLNFLGNEFKSDQQSRSFSIKAKNRVQLLPMETKAVLGLTPSAGRIGQYFPPEWDRHAPFSSQPQSLGEIDGLLSQDIEVEVTNNTSTVLNIHRNTILLEKHPEVKHVSIDHGANLDQPDMYDPPLEPEGFELGVELTENNMRKFLYSENTFPRDQIEEFLTFLAEQTPGVIAKNSYDIGSLRLPYVFEIETDTKDPIFRKPYRLNLVRQQQIDKSLLQLCETGVLQRGESQYGTPAFVIPKKPSVRGGAMSSRLILDYRPLNFRTKKMKFPLPDMRTILANLQGYQWYTTLDIKSAYHSVHMSPDAAKKAAVISGNNIYLVLRMPFGLANAPSYFSHIMQVILGDMDDVYCYLDDVIICSNGPRNEHITLIKKVILKLYQAGLKINGKGEYMRKEFEFLGKVVNAQGTSPLNKHVVAIQDFPRPRTIKDTQQFLGLMAWVSQYVHGFAWKIKPLSSILNSEFKWEKEQEDAFILLKRQVTKNSFLYFPDFSSPIYVATDCSDQEHSAICYQVQSYSRTDLPALEQLSQNPVGDVATTVTTNHPVVPPPRPGVPEPFALQAMGEPRRDRPLALAFETSVAGNFRRKPRGRRWSWPLLSEPLTHPGLYQENEFRQRKDKVIRATKKLSVPPDLTHLMKDDTRVHVVRAIGFYSGVFTGAALNYSTIEKEISAILKGIDRFLEYLYCANQCVIVTDSQPFCWALRFSRLGISRIERMILKLSQFPFLIIVAHMRGIHHPADFLTRIYRIPDRPVTPGQAKKAIVIRNPFKIGDIITVDDIIRELKKDPSIVYIPPLSEKQTKNKTKLGTEIAEQNSSLEPVTHSDFLVQESFLASPALASAKRERARKPLHYCEPFSHQSAGLLFAAEPLSDFSPPKQVSKVSFHEETSSMKRKLEISNVVDEQRKQSNLAEAIDKLKKMPALHVLHGMFLDGPVLMKRSLNLENNQVVLPNSLLPYVLCLYHLPTHCGGETLEKLINRDYFIPKLREHSVKFCSACAICTDFKPNNRQKLPLGVNPLPHRKCEVWEIDMVVGLVSHKGFDAYLSIIDVFSAFQIAIPCTNRTTAEATIQLLERHVITYFGPPKIIRCDNGPNLLVAGKFDKFLAFYGIRRQLSTPYSSKTHGRIEQANKIVTQVTMQLAKQHETNWVVILPLAIFSINCRPRKNFFGYSPMEIMMGRKIDFGTCFRNYEPYYGVHDQVQLMADIGTKVAELIPYRLDKITAANAARGGKLQPMPQGTLVYLKIERTGAAIKTKPKYYPNPYIVTRDHGQSLLIRGFQGLVIRAHKDNVKPCTERSYDLFASIPDPIKARLGYPFTKQEILRAIDMGKIPVIREKETPIPRNVPLSRKAAADKNLTPEGDQIVITDPELELDFDPIGPVPPFLNPRVKIVRFDLPT